MKNHEKMIRVCTVVLTGVCIALLLPALSQAAEPVFKNVPYIKDGGERQTLDIYLPKYPKEGDKLPVLVWVHGGGWTGGSKAGMPGQDFLNQGYAQVSINYRLSSQAIFPAQIEDCKAAIRWLRANAATYNFDPDRIGVWGASAGGHLVAFLGTSGETTGFDVGDNLDQSSKVQAVCDIFGPTDFTPMETLPEQFAVVAEPVTGLLGGPAHERKELAEKASPITYVEKPNAPFLILHGDEDMLVNVDQSIRLHDALQKAGVESQLIVSKGEGHSGYVFESKNLMTNIAEFFDKYLKQQKKVE